METAELIPMKVYSFKHLNHNRLSTLKDFLE